MKEKQNKKDVKKKKKKKEKTTKKKEKHGRTAIETRLPANNQAYFQNQQFYNYKKTKKSPSGVRYCRDSTNVVRNAAHRITYTG
ncbi:hypothetical protein M8J75_005622 [Diaphorina citri]|nr:hypothetical protein M8J75_005622 [Diaphorina citri]